MKKLKSLEDLFLHEMRDLYSAEKQLTKALPKMAKGANSEVLRQAFEEHLEQTKGQLGRLEQAFGSLGEKPTGVKCKAMEGLIEEGSELLENKEKTDPAVLDAGLIAAAQKVEHYEISGYGTAATYAKQLGHLEIVELLTMTLDEEKTTDKNLTKIATRSINRKADKDGVPA